MFQISWVVRADLFFTLKYLFYKLFMTCCPFLFDFDRTCANLFCCLVFYKRLILIVLKLIFRDIAYVTASGSIIATAGYSSDAINVVIWDTLAPPTTSRASIMCHEGFFLLSEFMF